MQTTKGSGKDLARLEKEQVFVPTSSRTSCENGNCSAGCKRVDITIKELVHLVLEKKRFKVTEAQTKGTGVLDVL